MEGAGKSYLYEVEIKLLSHFLLQAACDGCACAMDVLGG